MSGGPVYRSGSERWPAMGLSISDAVCVLLTRVAAEKALPFELKLPNATTRAAVAARLVPSRLSMTWWQIWMRQSLRIVEPATASRRDFKRKSKLREEARQFYARLATA